MIEKGIEPFTCLPANLIVLGIGEKLDRPVELAQIKVESDSCTMLLVLFDKRPEYKSSQVNAPGRDRPGALE